jgi:hypothetical protein
VCVACVLKSARTRTRQNPHGCVKIVSEGELSPTYMIRMVAELRLH